VRKATVRRWAALFLAVLLFALFSTVARAVESEIDHLVQILELKADSSVADVGAGSGEISITIAHRLGPQGTVYSTEINPELLNRIRGLVQKDHARNIIVVKASEHETGLPPACCDGIFLREVYHHLTNPIATDRSLYRALRPGGRLAIIDFEPIPGMPPPPGVPSNRGGHGVPKHVVAQELTGAGFELLRTLDWPISATVKHYCMLFKKPGASSDRSSQRHPPVEKLAADEMVRGRNPNLPAQVSQARVFSNHTCAK